MEPGAPPAAWSTPLRLAAAAGLAALSLGLACYHLPDVPLLDPDEPRYAAAGRTMAEGGSWLIPEFNGEPRINKPPLFYWLVALSYKLGDPASDATPRLPSIVLGLGMLALTVCLGRRIYGDATGFLAGLILASAPLFLAINRSCVIDQTFSTLLSLGLGALLLGYAGRWPWAEERWWSSPVCAAGLCMGLAFMAKGTAALLVLLAPLLFALAFARRPLAPGGPLQRWGLAAPACGLAVFLALGSWWYLFLIRQLGYDELKRLISYEIMARLQGAMHHEPPWYYLYVFPAVLFPWSIGLPGALGAAARRIEPDEGEQPGGVRGGPCATGLVAPFHVADAFLVAWCAAVVLFFSIPLAKLGTYVLPAFPAAALLIARFLLRLSGRGEPVPALWTRVTAYFACALALGATALFCLPLPLPDRWLDVLNASPVPPWLGASLVVCCCCLPWLWAARGRRAWLAALPLAGFVVALLLLMLPYTLPNLCFRSHRDLALAIRPYVEHAEKVYAVGSEEESLVYYLHRPVPEIRRPDKERNEKYLDVVAEALALAPPGKVLLFVHKKYFALWMRQQLPPDCRILEQEKNHHVVVLINQP